METGNTMLCKYYRHKPLKYFSPTNISFCCSSEGQQSIFVLKTSCALSPLVSKRGLPWTKVPVLQVSLHLLQLVRPEALVDPRCKFVAQGWDDVPVAVKANLLTHLEAGEKKAEIGNNLWRKTGDGDECRAPDKLIALVALVWLTFSFRGTSTIIYLKYISLQEQSCKYMFFFMCFYVAALATRNGDNLSCLKD